MEQQYKKVVKQADGISSYKTTTSGHFVLESPYMDCSARLSDNTNNISFGSFLTYLSLYDALRSNMSQYIMLAKFYEVLSNIKTEEGLVELKASLDELKAMGGIINQIYPMLAANINKIGIASAKTLQNAYLKMHEAEASKAKDKDKQESKSTGSTDGDTKPEVGSRDINNVADKTTRTIENANGVDSALEENYKLHVPDKTTDDLYPHLKRIKSLLNHYDHKRDQVYINELKRELFHTFEGIKKKAELEALDEVMMSFARQGDAGREFLKNYMSVRSNYSDKLKAKESEFNEFKDFYTKIMRKFEEFESKKKRGTIDTDDIDELIGNLRRLDDRLESNKQYMDRGQFSQYQYEIERRIQYLQKLSYDLDDMRRLLR
jgi:hypothetical protein